MGKQLVIVESPAKAKTIAKYLGAGYDVLASFGHIRDLPKTGMSIDIEHGFTPTYEVSKDKSKVVRELKAKAKSADQVLLASDEDREGEAIAWHVAETLKLDPKTTKRIVFHEITEPAIKAAVASPRTIDKNLVDAQQARRVLDRLVGYELSPVLWKKVRPGLSAGRVQSVAVRLIAEREQEIEAFSATSKYRVTGIFTIAGGEDLPAELPSKLADEKAAEDFLQRNVGATYQIASLETNPATKSPAAPFTTSTLQQEASRKLGFSVKQTMVLAQRLYEAGAITYMRTDSVNLSELAITAAAKAITTHYGDKYVTSRRFKTKSAGAQEAHEAIRPTSFEARELGEDRNQQRLYELIWKRAIASQMAEARLEKTKAEISISTAPERLQATGEMVVFDGFLAAYLESTDNEEDKDDKLLPALKTGESLQRQQLSATQTYDRPKPRYTEASLVKKLEEMGIGRPSTYAPTISTIQDRGYVEKGDMEGEPRTLQILTLGADDQIKTGEQTERTGAERAKLFPTPIGSLVTTFLVKNFPAIVDYDFTAGVETEFDQIEDGKTTWNAMIAEFYGPFHKTVEAAADISREEASGARDIGIDPKTKKPIIARMGRYGPMLQLGSAEDDEKPRFAPLPAGRKIENVTLEEALEQFTLPRVVGQTESGEEILANIGRFGPYVQVGKLYVSIKPDDPFNVTLERAKELIEAKKQADAAKNILAFEDAGIKVLNGRFGPYITDGTKNVKVPKDQEPAKLTLGQCQELLAAAPAKKRRKIIRRPRT